MDFDPGPTPVFADLFANAPDYAPVRDHFWYDWGPVFYRGRTDGSARVLCVASDPGPTERVAGRTLVGDAGQRVQGFLAKLGLTRSYLCVNAFSYALFPSHGSKAPEILARPDHAAWRAQLFAAAMTPAVEAVVAFGANAQGAVRLWAARPVTVPLIQVPHPSSRDSNVLLAAWRDAIVQLRAVVTPDPDGDASLPNYGATFGEGDYAPIPRSDLPFGVPPWLGDDRWGRLGTPRHNNSVARPAPDDRHTLTWICPRTGDT
jgi:uracil-DNA glycosylase